MAFRDLVLRNFRRKVFSLLLAILVWLTIYFADKKHRQSVEPQWPTNAAATYQ